MDQQLRDILERRLTGTPIQTFAKQSSIESIRSSISRLRAGKRGISLATAERLALALGYRLVLVKNEDAT